ncbi:hypothetical protein GCM10007275_08960 [Jeotgalicoccus coquinae]|uniref:Uncharacterized protein n=1 Tax=Jeotgalicoccus coquinae TaxID=709509 RepID=A0A6V7RM91_9STAP|nr:hypothetical protein [Jeotgalicoccus coquinae]MBB6422436.1 hypothetical protein [Jeotgalicoccus coquinae]GGE15867.1 hypothetical protein GCM10007275_08960 [Jeotgalicoccus coquinae]CAD2078631.1 hypothetical protein JEOCOQ751_01223 [Jeotgalicoccus coquinae]
MKLKVKVRDYESGISITKIDVPAESTVDLLLGKLVQEDLLFDSYLPNIKTMGYTYGEFHRLKTSSLFHGKEKAVLTSNKVEITITQKKSTEGHKAGQLLLDYSQLVNVVDKFKELEGDSNVEYGTVFFVQQEKHQYLIRYEEHGFELYHFKLQYDNAFKDEDRFPFLILELKTKQELTPSELKWIRTIMFPSKERKNPIIHLEVSKLNQDIIDELTTLVHRIMVIIGKFQVSKTSLESDGKLPSYVQLDEKNSIGFVEIEQLKRIVEA